MAYVWHASKFTARGARTACCASASSTTSRSSGTRGGRCSRGRSTGFSMSHAGTCERRMRRGTAKPGENSTIWDCPSPEVHHGRLEGGEVRPSNAEAGRADAAPDPESHQARRAGLRSVPRQRHHARRRRDTGRVCCGIELDPKYVDVVDPAWQDFTGQQATLEGDGRTFDEDQGRADGSRGMNRTMPPRDRGNRSADPRRASRSRGVAAGAVGLERGTAASRKGEVTNGAP